MSHDEPPAPPLTPARTDPGHAAADRLRGSAGLASAGVFVTGGLFALSLLPYGGRRATTSAVFACGAAVIGSALAAWLTGPVLIALAARLDALAGQTEAMDRLGDRIAEGLGRLAGAVEAAGRAAPAAGDGRGRDLAAIRRAIRVAAWDEAADLLGAFTDDYPDDPDAARVADELAERRRAAADELMAKVAAAREANDPERVIGLRDDLRPLVTAEALRELDRDLARWFLLLIHRRVRTGTVRPDVAALATRVAEALDDTPEGASLRASLPVLRRAAGLCARCGQPYAGIENACPVCTAAATAAALTTTPTPPGPAQEPDPDADPEPDPDPGPEDEIAGFRSPED